MSSSAIEIVNQSSGIYALPEIYDQLRKKLEDPHAYNAQIADIIQLDTGLTSSLLKIVNSAFYGFPSTISTITQAISIIGRTELAKLVLGKSVISVFDKLDICKKDLKQHWMHSLQCGLLSKQISKSLGNIEQSPDSLFVAGLLHDIGRLVIWHELPEKTRQLQQYSNLSTPESLKVEKSILGFCHTDVGSELLRKWKLPDILIESTQFHHEPHLSINHRQSCEIINIADITSRIEKLDEESYSRLEENTRIQTMDISINELSNIIKITQQQFSEMISLFLQH